MRSRRIAKGRESWRGFAAGPPIWLAALVCIWVSLGLPPGGPVVVPSGGLLIPPLPRPVPPLPEPTCFGSLSSRALMSLRGGGGFAVEPVALIAVALAPDRPGVANTFGRCPGPSTGGRDEPDHFAPGACCVVGTGGRGGGRWYTGGGRRLTGGW